MSLPATNLTNILAAALPIVAVLYLMIGRGWGGSKAGPAGWIVALLVATFVFGGNFRLIWVASGRSILLAIFVLYIIWMALLLYHVVNEAGAIGVIGKELPGLAKDKPSQALLLGWVFGSFLQGASGFGVPAAVIAPLLFGLGFSASSAVVIALLGHAWAVTFGSLGSSFYSLIAATGLEGSTFDGTSAIFLGVSCILCGIAVLWETSGLKSLKNWWGQLLLTGLVMSVVQYSLAISGLWSLAAFGAGIAGLAITVFDLHFHITDVGRWRDRFRRSLLPDSVQKGNAQQGSHRTPADKDNGLPSSGNKKISSNLWKALFPYLILTLIVVVGQLVLREQLAIITIDPIFPEVTTDIGWQTPAGPGRSINLFGHAGALLLYSSIISFGWFAWRGSFSEQANYSAASIIGKSVRGSIKPTIGIITLVAMAVTMQHAGMTQVLALALSQGTGQLFPFLSPFIGALGAFMTGSNTNSNVVFGLLQLETAVALGIPSSLILATQTAGGAIGSLFAPAKVIVGCSTVPGAKDSEVLRRATLYGLVIILILGLVGLLGMLLNR